LSIAKLGHSLIPVPPLAEQTRFVTRVEELMRLCDALAANWQRIASHFDLLRAV
jgi:type I restriction enzyme S subunit